MVKLDEQQPSEKKTNRDSTGPKSQLRGRDLVYIDIDDDVTSIVGKIKSSDQAVVALVPPKRVGVLQSVVNLKLLQRAAKTAQKRLAIVTTDPALINLASGLTIPVAKNINAQAVVPDVDGVEDAEDLIDGNEIEMSNVTARRSSSDTIPEDKEVSAAVAAIETDDRIHNDLDADGVPDDEQDKPRPTRAKSKVPNIDTLRKKIIIGGAIGVLVIGFLVWAIVFAPGATITIKAKTSSVDITKTLSLVPSTDKNIDDGVLSPVVKQKKVNESVKFEATGSKEVGEKATGTVAICNKQTYFQSAASTKKNTVSLPAGTTMYFEGKQFTIDAAIDIEGYSTDNGETDRHCETIKATATGIGSEYNIGSGSLLQISGYNTNLVAASAEGAFTGGSKETIKVVQQSDVEAAVAKLKEKGDGDAAKKELRDQMSETTAVIDNSFTVDQGDIKVSPAVGEKITDQQPSVSVEITYTLVGVAKDDLNAVIDTQLKKQVDSSQQKIYDNGLKSLQFSGFKPVNNGYTVTVKTSGHVGPVINEDDVKKQITGKKSEEIKALLKQTNGVSDVDVQLSPFWVNTAPAINKIKINFTVDE